MGPTGGRSSPLNFPVGGELTAIEAVRACIERIEEREADVHAWVDFDPEPALEEARARDAESAARAAARVPVGIKDMIDTADRPTSYGCPIFAGHRPAADAACVAALRAAGAVVLGKTTTTELAPYQPAPTRNPHDLGRTRAVRRAARPRRWPTGWCRSRSGPRPPARSCARRRSAASSASSRRSAWSIAPAWARRPRASTRSAGSPAARRTSRWCWACSRRALHKGTRRGWRSCPRRMTPRPMATSGPRSRPPPPRSARPRSSGPQPGTGSPRRRSPSRRGRPR